MMNGIIFCVCLTLAISVLPIVLKWCRKERKKNQVKKESQQNRSRWWIWSRDAAKGILMCLPLLHQKAQGKPDMKANFLWVRKLCSIKDRWDPLYTRTHQATQNGNVDKTWSSQEWKSDELMEDRQGDLLCSHSTRTDSLLKTIGWILTPKQNQKCRWNPDHSCTGEWSSAKEAEPILKRYNRRQRQTFCNMENVYVFNIASICIYIQELLRQFAFHQKYKRSHNETSVRHTWEIDNRTIRRDLWNK